MKRILPKYDDGKPTNVGEYRVWPSAVGASELNVTMPEIVVTGKDKRPLYQKYDAEHSTYDRAAVDEFARLIDPTGVLSIPLLVNSGKHLWRNPSISNAADFGLSMLSASPLVGRYSKAFSKLGGYNNLVKFLNAISSPVRMPLKWLAKDNSIDEMSKILSGKWLGKNTRINTPILFSRVATQSDPDLMYYGARYSSGEPVLAYRGHTFTGSYDYSNDRTKRALSDRYAGDAANDDRDLVKTLIYGEDLPDRMLDSLGVRRYKGYIVPTINDTIYLDPSYKNTLDSLIENNTIVPFNELFLRKDGDPRFDKQILDNVKRGLLKFNKDRSQYYANLSDLWDLNGTTFFIGDMFLNRVIDNGGSPFFLELNSPIKFIKDSRNDILPTVAPRLPLYRDKYNNITE